MKRYYKFFDVSDFKLIVDQGDTFTEYSGDGFLLCENGDNWIYNKNNTEVIPFGKTILIKECKEFSNDEWYKWKEYIKDKKVINNFKNKNKIITAKIILKVGFGNFHIIKNMKKKIFSKRT